MNLFLVANIIVFVFAFAGAVLGALKFFGHRKALYGQMISEALVCIVIGRLFNIVRLLSGDNLLNHFQLGSLAVVGSFIFFYSANYGALDSIVDDGSKEFFKYRMIGAVSPVVAVLIYYPLFYMGNDSMLWKVQGAVLLIFTALCSYFHLKHIFIPDVEFGVVRSLRPYNFLALLYMLSSIAECFALSRGSSVGTFIACCFSGIFVFAMMPLISLGLKKSRE